MMHGLSCREFVDFLEAYRDGTLEPAVAERFRMHMDACPPCVTFLEAYNSTVDMTRSLCCDEDEIIPPDVPEGLIRSILDARDQG
ncbi:MAG: zf-HC2 domain-containing protein [Phycisphaerales bacterium]|nr:zf-HC2 domain-containing protein [Phycisphaerales bacterium]